MQNDTLQKDPEIFNLIQKEAERQRNGLEMIASENYVSKAVLEAQGSILTNKYAEGYPGKRYYGGCEWVDQIESIAIQRLCTLFGCETANVQPHSGSQANMAVYLTLMKPGETLLGMNLAQGGHLTHGSPVNFSGRLYRVLSYGLDPSTHRIDYDQIRDLAKKEKPKMIIAGASSYPRTIDFSIFGEIAKETGAALVTDIAHIAGLVAVGLHPTPIPHADYVTSTTHKTLRGPRGGIIMGTKDKMKLVNSLIFPGIQGGPLEHVIAAKAVAFGEALKPDFKQYQLNVLKNCKQLADSLLEGGLALVTGGTDNHLLVVDLTKFADGSVTGKDAETWLDHAGITVNKNAIPNDPKGPQITSGIRIGSAALTSRGMGTGEMKKISGWILEALGSKGDAQKLSSIQQQVKTFTQNFPIPA